MSDYRALYRKWRPRTFDEVCGQDGITDILKYEVANNKLSHAYLFCGSRGTGKTSCAKILAKAVNCENSRDGNPCNECEACRSIDAALATDVIEMDAASNNGINDVRDMQDEIAFTPALLKYRVYIIDEVHMMSGQAFNALLKTLEEPPSYVIFILATTEYNKLPTTIVSRCQRFDFKRISLDVIIKHLLNIAEAEGVEITEDAARIIARVSRGGMRDAISLFELCASAHKKIDEALVFETVGSGNRESTYKLVRAVSRSDYSTVYEVVAETVMKSADISVFWQEIIDSYRDIMVVKTSARAKEYLDLTEAEYEALKEIAESFTMSRLSYHVHILESSMADMQRAYNSKRSIAEIALTRMCDSRLDSSVEALFDRIETLEREISVLKYAAPNKQPAPAQKPLPKPEKKVEVPVEKKPEAPVSETLYTAWGRALEKIKEVKFSLAASLSSATVYKAGNGRFVFRLSDFFAKKLSSSEQDLAILRGVIAEIEASSPDSINIIVQSATTDSSNPFSDIERAFM